MCCYKEKIEEYECSENDAVVRICEDGEYPGTRIGVSAILSFQFSPPRFL
jgi:hypothetical protein